MSVYTNELELSPRNQFVPCGICAFAALILGCVTGDAAGQTVPTAEPPPGSSMAIVQIVVDNSYRTDASLEQISLVADLIAPKTVNVPNGSSISQVVAQTYNFGASDLEPAYAQMSAAIRRLNGFERDEDLKAGVIAVPNLPEWGFAKNSVTASVAAETVPTPPAVKASLLRTTGKTFDYITDIVAAAGSADKTVMRFSIPYAQLRTPQWLAFLKRPGTSIQSNPIDVAFPEPVTGYTSTGATSTAAGFASLIASPVRKGVRLFVLDSCWPPDGYARSFSMLKDLINAVGKDYGIASTRSPAPFSDPKAKHCYGVSESLKGFHDADKAGAVEIVYIPLSADQGASGLLSDLVYLGLTIQRLQVESRGDTVEVQERVMKRIRAAARRDADAIVKGLPADASKKPFTTNQALLDCLWSVAHAWAARDNDTYFVVNESWTVPGGALVFSPLPAQRGIAVAAAGNEPKRNILADPIVDFAGRASTSDYVVAVLNMDGTGSLTCQSSTLDPLSLASVRAAGFDGAITTDCGTSFASPRVAWLIAAGESLRKGPIQPSDWPHRVDSLLKSSRRNTSLGGLLLDPATFLKLNAQ